MLASPSLSRKHSDYLWSIPQRLWGAAEREQLAREPEIRRENFFVMPCKSIVQNYQTVSFWFPKQNKTKCEHYSVIHFLSFVLCVVDPDPHGSTLIGSPRSGSVLGMGIRIQVWIQELVMATLAKRKRTKASIMVFSSISKRSEHLR